MKHSVIYCTLYDYYCVTRKLCTDRRVSISTEPTGFLRMYVIDGNVPKGVLLLHPHSTPPKLRVRGVEALNTCTSVFGKTHTD